MIIFKVERFLFALARVLRPPFSFYVFLDAYAYAFDGNAAIYPRCQEIIFSLIFPHIGPTMRDFLRERGNR